MAEQDLKRQSSNETKSTTILPSSKKLAKALIFGTIISLIAATLVSLLFYKEFLQSRIRSNKDVMVETVPEDPSAQDGALTYSTDKPSEEPVAITYKAAAEDPLSISLPEVGIKGFIQKVGIDQNNEIAVPNNVFLAGWYINSSKPGQKGLSIIDGHVDGPTRGGIFANLTDVNAGQLIEIEYGNGTKVQFKVVDIVQVKVNEAYDVLFAKRPEIESQLNLITCGGNFDFGSGSYEDRIIVVGARI